MRGRAVGIKRRDVEVRSAGSMNGANFRRRIATSMAVLADSEAQAGAAGRHDKLGAYGAVAALRVFVEERRVQARRYP